MVDNLLIDEIIGALVCISMLSGSYSNLITP